MKRFKIIFITVLLLSLQAMARPEVVIPETVEISQRELLRLSDIVQVSGGSEELLGLLEKVVIREDSRELLLSQSLLSQEILGQIRKSSVAGDILKRMNPLFRIPSKVKVNFSKTPISREET
ncbi:MAG: flagella basal body P-ring formation protein FlgA, partial [Bdellovibrio sp.]